MRPIRAIMCKQGLHHKDGLTDRPIKGLRSGTAFFAMREPPPFAFLSAWMEAPLGFTVAACHTAGGLPETYRLSNGGPFLTHSVKILGNWDKRLRKAVLPITWAGGRHDGRRACGFMA